MLQHRREAQEPPKTSSEAGFLEHLESEHFPTQHELAEHFFHLCSVDRVFKEDANFMIQQQQVLQLKCFHQGEKCGLNVTFQHMLNFTWKLRLLKYRTCKNLKPI